jgi:hypothetical protein
MRWIDESSRRSDRGLGSTPHYNRTIQANPPIAPYDVLRMSQTLSIRYPEGQGPLAGVAWQAA